MSQAARFQETPRRLAIFDEGFAEAGVRSRPVPDTGAGCQDRGAAAGSGVGGHRVIGSLPARERRGRARAAGATKDEIADVLLAIILVAGLSRIVSAAPEVATALGYDIAVALEEPDGY